MLYKSFIKENFHFPDVTQTQYPSFEIYIHAVDIMISTSITLHILSVQHDAAFVNHYITSIRQRR